MKTHILLFAGMLIACTSVAAQPLMETSWLQSTAPSTLPDEIYRNDEENFYVIDRERYEYDHSHRHRAYENFCVKNAMNGSSTPDAINWHALPPFQARYSPQLPTSWLWRHPTPSRQRIFWHHRSTR